MYSSIAFNTCLLITVCLSIEYRLWFELQVKTGWKLTQTFRETSKYNQLTVTYTTHALPKLPTCDVLTPVDTSWHHLTPAVGKETTSA